MPTPDSARHLTPSPGGVLTWLGQPMVSLERRLFEHILLTGRPQPIDMHGLAEQLGEPVAAIARALFALNRHQSLSILEEAPAARGGWQVVGLGGLADELVALASPGQRLLLASADGLCIARAGWTRYEAEVMAARPPEDHRRNHGEIVPLHFAGRSFQLSCNARIDLRNPALLRLGHRLLRACGPLAPKENASC